MLAPRAWLLLIPTALVRSPRAGVYTCACRSIDLGPPRNCPTFPHAAPPPPSFTAMEIFLEYLENSNPFF